VASQDTYRVPLLEVAAAAGWPESQLGEAAAQAERLKILVEPDWADRPSVLVSDAAPLFKRLLTHTVLDAAQVAAQRSDSAQTWTLPPVKTKDGRLVPAVTRPGDGSAEDQPVLDWSKAPW
jgi:hypothetical protein